MLPRIEVRNTRRSDFNQITELCRKVYPESIPWNEAQLASHLEIFPEGQFVAVAPETGRVVGMAASLIVCWDDYEGDDNWREFTDHGMFTNHDPEFGRTLYGAEVMVDPHRQRRGIGSKIYAARRELATSRGLLRIRAGARLRGYHRYADHMTAEEYVLAIIHGKIKDPTLTFQLRHGFEVIRVVHGYLRNDPESLGYAAVIEWLNAAIAKPEDYARRSTKFLAKTLQP